MSYILNFGISLGSTQTGLTLNGQLVNVAGSNVGSALTSGFIEIGNGNYSYQATIPDSHRGGIKFYVSGSPGTILAFGSINPQDAENSDVKTSSISASGVVLDINATLDAMETTLGLIKDKTDLLLILPHGQVASASTINGFVATGVLSSLDSAYLNAYILFTSGNLSGNTGYPIAGYSGGSKAFFVNSPPFRLVPDIGSSFVLLGSKF